MSGKRRQPAAGRPKVRSYRRAVDSDCDVLSDLVRRSFNALVAQSWSPSARRRFLAESSSRQLRKGIRDAWHADVALSEGNPAGFLLMPRPSLLAVLFVDPQRLRRGIGRGLWERARRRIQTEHPEVHTVELNATAASIAFYRAMGFAPISSPFEYQGGRATRMACWLAARGLNAELR